MIHSTSRPPLDLPFPVPAIADWASDNLVGPAALITDLSGNGNDSVQASVLDQLGVVPSDPDFNGRTALQGGGTRFARCAAFTQGPIAQPYTKYCVIKFPPAWPAGSQFPFGGATASGRGDIYTPGTAGRLGGFSGVSVEVAGVSTGDIGIARYIANGISGSIEWTPFVGSPVIQSGNVGPSQLEGSTLFSLGLGANFWFIGKGTRFTVVSGAVSPGDDALIKAYLFNRYRP